MPSSRPLKKTTTRGTKVQLRNASTDKRLASSPIKTGYSASKNGVRVTRSNISRGGEYGTDKKRPTSVKTSNAPKGAFGYAIWNDPKGTKKKAGDAASRTVRAMEKNFYKKKQR